MSVRVRFAPSPTGFLHIGTCRTVLFNYLYARHMNGQFVLRIEDTDQEREVPGAVANIIESLRWLGLTPDEGPEQGGPHGPYIQSQRLAIYREWATRLVNEGKAYLCFMTAEEMEALRAEQIANGLPPGYDRRYRWLSLEERAERVARGHPYVIRFAMPTDGQTTFHDFLRGDITVENATLDDFILIKSDGFPTYNFAHVVDDILMRITHVMRGPEFVPSTPKYVQLYHALGHTPPTYIHLPMVLGPDKQKLSKRHGATAVLEYRDQGYLPEAIINFLALLGWSLDDKTDVIDRATLIANFSLERLGKSPAVFNREKLDWLNGVYIRALEPTDLAERLLPFLERDLPPHVARPLDRAYVAAIAPLIQEKIKRLDEISQETVFFFTDPEDYSPALLIGKGMTAEDARTVLTAARAQLAALPEWTTDVLEPMLRALAQDLGLKVGQVFGTLRVATTGRTVAPGAPQTIAVLGRRRTLDRLDAALDRLTSPVP